MSPQLELTRELPLRWSPRNEPDDALVRAQDNASVLHALTALDAESGLTPSAGDGDAPTTDLQRLEAKVDTLLELVTAMLIHDRLSVPKHRVWLRTDGIHWLDADPPEVGASVEVSLYMSPRFPRPLRLAVNVLSVSPENAGSRVQTSFSSIDPSTRNYLEKQIFRHHRRAVAEARRQRSGAG